MITALHSLVYADDPDAARAFFRDVLQLPGVDTGGGWLIFRTGPSELGVHPAMDQPGGAAGTHNISFYCDDLQATLAELAQRGLTPGAEVTDAGYGLTTKLALPGGVVVELYQPHYRTGSDSDRP